VNVPAVTTKGVVDAAGRPSPPRRRTASSLLVATLTVTGLVTAPVTAMAIPGGSALPLPAQPIDMTFAPNGTGYISLDNGTLAVLEPDFTLGTPIDVPGDVTGAVAFGNGKLYTALYGANQLAVVTPGATPGFDAVALPAGSSPGDVAVGPDGTVYTSNVGNGTVSVIDPTTLDVIRTVAVGGYPQSIAVSPTTGTVYTTNSWDNTLSVIPQGSDTASTVSTPAFPFRVVAGPDGAVYVLASDPFGETPPTLTAWTETAGVPGSPPVVTNVATTELDAAEGPRSVALLPDGAVLVANIASVTTVSTPMADDSPTATTSVPGAFILEGVAVAPDGIPYALNTGDSSQTAVVRLVDPPAEPSPVSAVTAAAGVEQATVSWTPGVGPVAVTGYWVMAVAADGTMKPPVEAPAGDTSAVVTGLEANAPYTFWVVALAGSTPSEPAASGAVVILPAVSVGSVVITSFRQSGPNGAGDSFVQLRNADDTPIPLSAIHLTGGSGMAVDVSQAGLLQPGQSYLIAGPDYSGPATADLPGVELGSGGVRVLVDQTTGRMATDAAGPVGSGFFRGTGLPALTGTPVQDYAWARITAWDGTPVNTGNTAADFQLVSASGGSVGGRPAVVGVPAPGSAGIVAVSSGLLDGAAPVGAAPNRVVSTSSNGTTLTVRRTLTNTGNSTLTSLALRITSLSQEHGAPPPGASTPPARPAWLQVAVPASPTSSITRSDSTTGIVQNLSPTGGPGGLYSVLPVDLGADGLAPGESIDVAVTFSVLRGGSFWFSYSTIT
jgi:YVTN family beta-propeller protein